MSDPKAIQVEEFESDTFAPSGFPNRQVIVEGSGVERGRSRNRSRNPRTRNRNASSLAQGLKLKNRLVGGAKPTRKNVKKKKKKDLAGLIADDEIRPTIYLKDKLAETCTHNIANKVLEVQTAQKGIGGNLGDSKTNSQ
ncbi:hypothetical protein PIB30_013307 [Stylosanthes scabra]|uniref:Uncharacterized protein n=1 Tax=Stylosanthes scabra TaxID=79078 RepID=A0ABU6T837_9FABA|nr:hypothetical protein [Stylosanthes scabra]